MTTVETLLARQRELRLQIAARMDGVPNLRDYGVARRADCESDIKAYHAETARLHAEMEAVAVQRRTAYAQR